MRREPYSIAKEALDLIGDLRGKQRSQIKVITRLTSNWSLSPTSDLGNLDGGGNLIHIFIHLFNINH